LPQTPQDVQAMEQDVLRQNAAQAAQDAEKLQAQIAAERTRKLLQAAKIRLGARR
jgi:hypothetical protein